MSGIHILNQKNHKDINCRLPCSYLWTSLLLGGEPQPSQYLVVTGFIKIFNPCGTMRDWLPCFHIILTLCPPLRAMQMPSASRWVLINIRTPCCHLRISAKHWRMLMSSHSPTSPSMFATIWQSGKSPSYAKEGNVWQRWVAPVRVRSHQLPSSRNWSCHLHAASYNFSFVPFPYSKDSLYLEPR